MEFLGPLELMVISFGLLMITVPPLLPLINEKLCDLRKFHWHMPNSLTSIIHCFYCKIVEWVVLVRSTFKFFTFCWYLSSSIKVETTNSSWKHEFFVVIHAEENSFALCFFYDVDVIRMYCYSTTSIYRNP